MLLKQDQPFRESSYLKNLNQYQNIILTNYSGYPMINVFETHIEIFHKETILDNLSSQESRERTLFSVNL